MGGRRAVRKLKDAAPESAVVQDMTPDGQGVVSVAGKRVFVDGAISGETVTWRRLRVRRNYDEAELLAVDQPSPDRVVPRCRYFGTCGGCSLQHLSAAGQVRLKESVLAENLRRIGAVTPGRWLPAVTGPAWGYRRRARLSVRYVEGKGRVLVGFSERGSPYVADMLSCEILHPAVAQLIAPMSDLIGQLSLRQRIPQVEVAVADNATVLVFRVLDAPDAADTGKLLEFGKRHGVRILLQGAGPDSITGLQPGLDDGELWYRLPGAGLQMRFGPTDFIQVNAQINQCMIELASELLEPGPATRLLDLYCGIGNFTLALGRHAGNVLGVEGEPGAVARARANAEANGIANAEFRCADLSTADACSAWAGQKFDAVLLDPPRAGAAAMLRPLAGTGAGKVLYVSCHPGTLARDAGVLVHELGYRLTAAGILDMFPATGHVESVALFERR